MVKIIQTYVDMKKINEIDRRIDKLKQTIFDSESEIEQIKKQRMNLMTTQFCGKEILYEYTLDHKNEYKKDYTLAIIMYTGKSDFKMHAHVHRSMLDLNTETYHAEVGEHGVNWHYPDWWNDNSDNGSKSQYDIKTFEEAKELARTWLAEIIEKYGGEPCP
jgi:hypothetical protein